MRTIARLGALFCTGFLCAQTGVTLEGVVTNPITRTGIAGVKVVLFGPLPNGGVNEATTGDSGDYRFSGLPPGDYLSRFAKPGYFIPGENAADAGPLGEAQRIKIGRDSLRLNREMIPLGALSGRVVAPDGKPAARAKVEAVALGEPVTATADDDGRFLFDQLIPGTYKLLAKPPTAPARKQGSPDAVRVETVPTYYPSVADMTEAQPVEVRGALEQAGLEIHLQSVQVYRVRGIVVDDAGRPVKDAGVRLINAAHRSLFGGFLILPPYRFLLFGGAAPWDDEASFTTGADGKFEFPAVRSGDWRLLAESTGTDPVSRNDVTRTGHASVLVARHDSDDLEVRVSSPPSNKLVIDWGGLPAVAEGFIPMLRLMGVDTPETPVALTRNGSLRFPELNAGRYRMLTMPTLKDGYNVAAVWLGEREVTGLVVELNAASPPIRVVMNAEAGAIGGTVDNGARAIVLVAPSDAGEQGMLLAVDCGEDGSFRIPGMPPGDYSVVAYDRVGARNGSEVSIPAILAPAARARVEEGATATVRLNVNRWPD
jgi:hypothetical protein